MSDLEHLGLGGQEKLKNQDPDPGMPKPRSLEKWAEYCWAQWHLDEQVARKALCLSCARAYAAQEVTSQRIQIAVLIRLLERIRDAADPEEYLDDVAAVDDSKLADEVRVFFRERDALLAVVRAAHETRLRVMHCKICGHTWLLTAASKHYTGCLVAHPDVQRLLKEVVNISA